MIKSTYEKMKQSGITFDPGMTESEFSEAGFSRLISGSPKLIPVFGHRYMPLIGGCENPPVISTVGRDTIFYGAALEDYLETEFICREYRKINADALPYIPVWTDIIQHT